MRIQSIYKDRFIPVLLDEMSLDISIYIGNNHYTIEALRYHGDWVDSFFVDGKISILPCRFCGCDIFHDCDGGCYRVEGGLCSQCAEKIKTMFLTAELVSDHIEFAVLYMAEVGLEFDDYETLFDKIVSDAEKQPMNRLGVEFTVTKYICESIDEYVKNKENFVPSSVESSIIMNSEQYKQFIDRKYRLWVAINGSSINEFLEDVTAV